MIKEMKWLDDIISSYEYMAHISSCLPDIESVFLYDGSIHLHKGLELLAHRLGKTITYDPNYYNNKGKMSFDYKGHEVFQLWIITKE